MLKLCEEITPRELTRRSRKQLPMQGGWVITDIPRVALMARPLRARWDSGGMAGGFEMFFDDMEISFAFSLCERTVLFFQWREGGREGKVPRNKGATRDTIRSPSVRIFPSRESSKNPC